MSKLLISFLLLHVCIALYGQKPNIIILVADDAGYRDFGCYGNAAVRTPAINALAMEGLKATKAFLTTPQCSPSRISMLSGQYAHTTKTEDLHTALPAGIRLLPHYLQEAGYFTGWMLKKHLGKEGEKQFQWYADNDDKFPLFLDAAGGKPFFMWAAFTEPHRPYKEENPSKPHDPATVLVPPYLADNPETRQDLADYYDEISRMDQKIDRMIKELKRRGLYDNSLIVFVSDNGAPFPREKGTLYDAGIRTPFIAVWRNKLKKEVVYDDLLSMIDLAPTCLDAAGIPQPPDMVGKSFLPLLMGQSLEAPAYVFSERNWHDTDEHIRSVRTRRYKLIKNAYIELPYGNPADVSGSLAWLSLKKLKDGGNLSPEQARMFQVPRPMIELYDMEKDPYELNNLAGNPEYFDIILELSKALHQWMRDTDDFPASERRKEDIADRVSGAFFSPDVEFNSKGN